MAEQHEYRGSNRPTDVTAKWTGEKVSITLKGLEIKIDGRTLTEIEILVSSNEARTLIAEIEQALPS